MTIDFIIKYISKNYVHSVLWFKKTRWSIKELRPVNQPLHTPLSTSAIPWCIDIENQK